MRLLGDLDAAERRREALRRRRIGPWTAARQTRAWLMTVARTEPAHLPGGAGGFTADRGLARELGPERWMSRRFSTIPR
jgi:hypothetical protein